MRYLFVLVFVLAAQVSWSYGQVGPSRIKAVMLQATVQKSPPQIKLSWFNDTFSEFGDVTIWRRNFATAPYPGNVDTDWGNPVFTKTGSPIATTVIKKLIVIIRPSGPILQLVLELFMN